MLRAHLFVDLYGVVRQGLRASVESYSIKKLEPFYGFTREIDLQDANRALRSFESALELEDVPSIAEETRRVVRAYNQDDCASASALRDWLEALRAQLIAGGTEVPRPAAGRRGSRRRPQRMADQDRRPDRAAHGRCPDRSGRTNRGAAGPLDTGERSRLAPQGGQGGVVGVFPPGGPLRRRPAG